MEYIELDGHRVPRLGMGTWQLEGEQAEQAVRTGIEVGYRHIDTAQMYQNEDRIGKAWSESEVGREELFITTKLWRENLESEAVLRTTMQSLADLRTDYVDLLLIHWPVEDVPLADTLGAMQQLQRDGHARLIGVSNFPERWFADARAIAPVVCNQVEYHPYLDQKALREQVRDAGGFLTAYCPLARGSVAQDTELAAIGEPHGKTPVQVALRWLLQQPGVVAIPKGSSRGHLEANLAVFDFALDDEEMARIDGRAGSERLIDPSFAPEW
ncbi:MAG: aldo/keto reductase [Planctomycetota bacterium]